MKSRQLNGLEKTLRGMDYAEECLASTQKYFIHMWEQNRLPKVKTTYFKPLLASQKCDKNMIYTYKSNWFFIFIFAGI